MPQAPGYRTSKANPPRTSSMNYLMALAFG